MSETQESGVRIPGGEDLTEVYSRFGRSDFLASFAGMLTALGTLTLLSALFAAGQASIDFQLNLLNDEGGLDEASVIGIAVAAIVVFVAFVVGGFAAGRMARYDGGLNGVGAGVWMLLLVTVFAALGAWVGAEYNAFNRIDLPNWVSQIKVDDATVAAIVASVAMAIAVLLGGYIGGRMGELYHRRVDAAIVDATR